MSRPPIHRQIRDGETGVSKRIQVVDPALVREHIRQWREALASCNDTVQREYANQARLQVSASRIRGYASEAIDLSNELTQNDFTHLDYFIFWLQINIWGLLEEEMETYNTAIGALGNPRANSSVQFIAPLNIEGILGSMRDLLRHLCGLKAVYYFPSDHPPLQPALHETQPQ